MNSYQKKPVSFPGPLTFQIERMEKTARYFGQSYSSYVRSLDRENWNSLSPEQKEAIKLIRI